MSAGDTDAFAHAFEAYARPIYNYVFRRTGNWATAEDLLSVVFLEAWRRRDTQLESDKVLPWLYGIATNVLRNQGRAERRYAAALSRVPHRKAEPDFAEQSDERIDDERRMTQVLTLISSLDGPQQDVFVLCEWMHLSYADTAEALAIPIGTVRSRLARARRHLGEEVAAQTPATDPKLKGLA